MPRPKTPPLFDAPAYHLAGVHVDLSTGRGAVKWTRDKRKAAGRCDVCMRAYAAHQRRPEHVPAPPMSRPAAYRRTQEGVEELLVCLEHKAVMQTAEKEKRR